jgi:hypothetical protein
LARLRSRAQDGPHSPVLCPCPSSTNMIKIRSRLRLRRYALRLPAFRPTDPSLAPALWLSRLFSLCLSSCTRILAVQVPSCCLSSSHRTQPFGFRFASLLRVACPSLLCLFHCFHRSHSHSDDRRTTRRPNARTCRGIELQFY